jgi:hypothetical protein
LRRVEQVEPPALLVGREAGAVHEALVEPRHELAVRVLDARDVVDVRVDAHAECVAVEAGERFHLRHHAL